MIPEKYRDLLARDGWKVYFKDCLYLAEQENTKKLGVTYPQGKIIVVAGQNIGNMQGILYHEIGHAMDNIYKIITTTNETWYDIYMNCKDNYIVNLENNSFKEYIKSSRAEFFAGMFIEYLLYPDYLQEFGPDIYNFINLRLSIPMLTSTEFNLLIDCICFYTIVGIVIELIDIIKPTKKKIDTK